MGNAEKLAQEMIASVGGGEARPELVEALAAAVLAAAGEAVRLALEVQAGGPHAVRRAIELAALVLKRRSAELASER